MTSTVSSFFSRDAFLRRQSRTRTRKNPAAKPMHLQIIPEQSEEDEPRSSCASDTPSLASPNTSSSPKRKRHPNIKISDIRIARDTRPISPAEGDDDDALFIAQMPPRPAPRPPQMSDVIDIRADESPVPSPDSFRLTFTDLGLSLKFPHPPLPTPASPTPSSPTPSLTTCSSPDSRSTGLPITPSSSDDEHANLTIPRWTLTRPLVITKRTTPARCVETPLDALEPAPSSPDIDADADEDADWYTQELGGLLTLCSPLPPSFPISARPESICAPPRNKPLPALPRPSAQLDPAFPRRSPPRIPTRPPPPVPPIPAHLRARPPPRMSIPFDIDDFDFDHGMGSPTASPNAEASSAGSRTAPSSPGNVSISSGSVYSQDGEGDDDLAFAFDLDLDIPMRLPLSLPSSPLDLEADIATGLEELRRAEHHTAPTHDGPALRSRWSSSTLSSVQEPPRTPSKLRLYFGGTKKRGSGPPPPMSPTLPASPGSPVSPGRRRSPGSPAGRTVRRRGSRSSASGSSVASDESTGSGLRRKPIPVEMFLRS